jgi:hypothetical protein
MSMDIAATVAAAVATLLGVLIGGSLTVWNQDRMWRRDHARQWRDIRLSAYKDFLSAYRAYLAFTQDPNSKITAIQHPRRTDELIPLFDADGRPYREKLEGARMTVTLVSQNAVTRDALFLVMQRVRAIAAARAIHSPDEMPDELFLNLFAAHNAFESAARNELGLPPIAGDL